MLKIAPGATMVFPFKTKVEGGALKDPNATPVGRVVHNDAFDDTIVVTIVRLAEGNFIAKATSSGTWAINDYAFIDVAYTMDTVTTGQNSEVFYFADARVNVGKILDQDVTLTNNLLDVNAKQYGGNATGALPPTLAQLQTASSVIGGQYSALSSQVNSLNNDMSEGFIDLEHLAGGDQKIDKTNPAQWFRVVCIAGTSTELVRQALRDLDGAAINAANPINPAIVAEAVTLP